MKIENHYEDARRNPHLRQSFLETIDLEKYAPFIINVMHKNEQLVGEAGVPVPMRAIHYLTSPLLTKDSDIHVFNRAFDVYSWNEFYNILLHHEGFHAKDFQSESVGLGEMNRARTLERLGQSRDLRLIKAKREFVAYQNQIRHPSFKKCSSWFKGRAIGHLKEYQKIIKRLK